MNELELIRERLSAIPISELAEFGKRAGVSFGTLHKIKYGQTKNPRFETVKKLTDYFRLEAA